MGWEGGEEKGREGAGASRAAQKRHFQQAVKMDLTPGCLLTGASYYNRNHRLGATLAPLGELGARDGLVLSRAAPPMSLAPSCPVLSSGAVSLFSLLFSLSTCPRAPALSYGGGQQTHSQCYFPLFLPWGCWYMEFIYVMQQGRVANPCNTSAAGRG